MNSDPTSPAAGALDAAAEQDSAPPRLAPRPLYRPTVDPAAAAAFGRPDGVDSSFAPGADRTADPKVAVRRPDPVLAEAFGRHAEPDPRVPASLLAPEAKLITVLLDHAAASGLDSQELS